MNTDLSHDLLDQFNPYKNYDNVKHAIEIWENKGKHSEFWYKLDYLVGKIKDYKKNFGTVDSKPSVSKSKLRKVRHLRSKKTILIDDKGSP